MNEAEIDKLGVYELRELARKLGVKSPTTKKIQQLKTEIALIQNGQLKAAPSNKIGRPPKSLTRSKDDFSGFLIPKDIAEILEDKKSKVALDEMNMKKIIFKSAPTSFMESISSSQNFGYIRKTQNDHYYFWSEYSNDYSSNLLTYIPETLIQSYKLRVGDYVCVKAEFYPEKNYSLASDVLSINGTHIKAGERLEPVDMLKYIIPTLEMNLMFNERMCKGGRAIACYNTRETMSRDIINYANEQIKFGKKVIIVGCEITPEMFTFIEGTEIKLFATKFGDGLESSYNVVVDAINHAQTLACDNFDVVVIMFDTLGILQTMKLYFEANGQHPSSGVQLTKTLFGIGRAYSDTSSISTIACVMEDEYNGDFISKDISRVACCCVGNFVL